MNEILIAFNLPSNTTIEQSDTKTILILTTRHKHSNFTIVLACIVNGTKLSPVIIFKLKKVSREEFSNSVIIHANFEGWMNKNKMVW